MIIVTLFSDLLNMRLRQRRPSYDHKSSLWPPAGIIMMMIIIVVHAKTYNYNYDCCHTFLRFIEYALEATPSILWIQIVLLAARRGDYDDDYYCCARQELDL